MEIRPPVRAAHAYVQHLHAPPERVFPLLCPVREREWTPGWEPRLVLSASGVAEPGCVFTTEVEGREAIWVVTVHDPAAGRIEMIETVPGLVLIRLWIELGPDGEGGTRCEVRYEYTALSADGEAFVAARTPEWYLGFQREWESLLERHLAD